jgi:Ssp1 endopeptidase immunity protein Rap1a
MIGCCLFPAKRVYATFCYCLSGISGITICDQCGARSLKLDCARAQEQKKKLERMISVITKRLVLMCLVAFLCCASIAQIQKRQQLPGRYFTPAALAAQLSSADTERSAQSYLEGSYDLTQDSGQSCAVRQTTTPVLLEKVFSDYLRTHPELKNADRTAAGVAAQAFAEYWPCH